MPALLNRAKVSCAAAGTGSPITLGAAVPPFQTFAAAGAVDQTVYRYLIEDGTAWELGSGLYTASGTMLTRNLIASSTGSLLNLSGSETVACAPIGSDYHPYEAASASDYPKSTDFPTWFNQGSAALTTVANGVLMSAPQSANAQVLRTVPATPFSVYARFKRPIFTMTQFTSFGLTLFNNGNNDSCRCWYGSRANATAFQLSIMLERFASSTFSAGWGTATYSGVQLAEWPDWLRLDVTSTTVTAYASPDGINWIQLGSDTLASFMGTPTHVGLVFAPAATPAVTNYAVCSAFSFQPPVF